MRPTAVFHIVLWAAAGLAAAAPAAVRHAAPADPCGGLSRADRRVCEADQAKLRTRRERAQADPCGGLSRADRRACEADQARAADTRRRASREAAAAPRTPAVPAVRRTSPAAARELQPDDLLGGAETPSAPGLAAPALRGALGADLLAPAARNARRPAHLREVVLEDGQNLADLAARTGVSVADLARLNGIASVDDVPTGMALKLPPGARAAAAVPSSAPEAARTAAALPPSAPGAGARPYASLGSEGAEPSRGAVAPARGGRTQADALAAYAVASARAPRVTDRPEATHDRFVWPLRTAVVSAYGDHGAGRRNDGVDLSARPGDPVRAAAAGEVVYAGKEIAATGGNLVLLKHADGWVTAYSHLGRLTVAMRQTVDQGQQIAEAADGIGAAVHFEVRQPGAEGARPVDPASVLPARAGDETGRGA